MKITALLTGRGGNTLKDKNVLPVLGKPLLYYPASAAKKSGVIDEFYVSSDCDKILSAAEEIGYTKIVRPLELATATAKHLDVIRHALQKIDESTDVLVVLMANTGTIKPEWIKTAVEILKAEPELSAVVPVYQDQDHHPYRAKTLNDSGELIPFFDFGEENVSTNRQELSDCFFLCHSFWAMNLKNSFYSAKGQKPWTFLGDRIKPLVVDESFDVHTIEDLGRTENWLRKNKLG
ncbi:cytidylyltransferase domain-containing protein [Idiomarina aquatica]|uniref:CMP-N-acetylneuraminic acid synthetase n=1 Tax=Idiomarina aquatica TaxID=1327752 RepID=A0AA94EHJ5_9GAMM|nr:NTP transferase domain-containing protein [Idiomarina aquatica]RUO45194.1 CMP-N-acetylneuraminic acid synthetase [Idiomarina aquatica]